MLKVRVTSQSCHESVRFQAHDILKTRDKTKNRSTLINQMINSWRRPYFLFSSVLWSYIDHFSHQMKQVNFTYLRRGDLDVDDDGGEGSLPQLRWVVDGVCVKNYQLQSPGQFKNPLNLTLDFSWKRESVNTYLLTETVNKTKLLFIHFI